MLLANLLNADMVKMMFPQRIKMRLGYSFKALAFQGFPTHSVDGSKC